LPALVRRRAPRHRRTRFSHKNYRALSVCRCARSRRPSRRRTRLPTTVGGPVEAPVVGLNQPSAGGRAVRAPTQRAEAVNGCQCAFRRHFEDRASAAGPFGTGLAHRFASSRRSRAGDLDQPGLGIRTVRASTLSAEAVNGRQCAAGRNFEDCSIAIGAAEGVVHKGTRQWTE